MKKKTYKPILSAINLFVAALMMLVMVGCDSASIVAAPVPDGNADLQLLRGDAGIGGFGNNNFQKVNRGDGQGGFSTGRVVNNYLWRASLETLAFMPMAQVDPIGGVIISDWASIPKQPNKNERYKINVFIFGTALRADALRVKVFKQTSSGNSWRDIGVSPAMANKLELTILTRARAIKIAATQR